MRSATWHRQSRAFLLSIAAVSLFSTQAFSEEPQPMPGLTASELQAFERGLDAFAEVSSVQGTEPGAEDRGLGPRFNGVSCLSCHSQPAAGGTSPALNPQIDAANRFGARNNIPFFVTPNGPVREARFRFGPDGERDGGVHALFVISGRRDAGSCNIAQPDFAAESKKNNLSFRIPTPVFGAGLIEAIDDKTIIANKLLNAPQKLALGIDGHENRNGNDGTISRFGWKAQNKSLLLFAGEAYNVEQGVTSELFQTEREEAPQCLFNETPEDKTNLTATTLLDGLADIQLFVMFMRFLAPPEPLPAAPATLQLRKLAAVKALPIDTGRQLFTTIGCAHCHTPSLTTGNSSFAALKNKRADLYSDLLVHHMGPNLADEIIQGAAGIDEFRTAPLWGVGKRLFFLHDGRTSDLTEAILAHASGQRKCNKPDKPDKADKPDRICASEANTVIENFRALATTQKAALIQFLQSL